MYEDLIKKLRYCGNAISCPRCPYWEGCGGSKEDLNQAADAIEELKKKLYFQDITTAQILEMYMPFFIPKWIPVTERLPEESYGCLAVVWDNPRYGGGDVFLNYYPEFIGWDGERWNDADGEEIPIDVVYWMRLPQIPEPPKEET